MAAIAAQSFNVVREPSNSTGEEVGRRLGFKLPAALNTEDLHERSVWSPNHRNASIVANGDLRSSNSPRTNPPTGSLLASQASVGSNISSPKPGTPTRFEDPLLSMPSFRRSGGSLTLEAGSAAAAIMAISSSLTATPTPPSLSASPSFRAGLASSSSSHSFSARRNSDIDSRRSLPGAAAPSSAVTSPGEAGPSPRPPGDRGAPGRQPSLSLSLGGGLLRGNSDSGNVELIGYASSSFAGSESGGPGEPEPGLDDDESADPFPDSDTAASAAAAGRALPGRRHSAFLFRSPGSGSALPTATACGGGSVLVSPAARLQMRCSEEEDFMLRLQHNRSSWRERPGRGSQGAAAALSFGGAAPGTTGPCEGGLQTQTHAALEQLRGELKSLSTRSMHPSGSAAGTAVAATESASLTRPLSAGSAAPAGGGGARGATVAAAQGGVGGGTAGLGPSARMSDGQNVQLSPSRLSLSRHFSSSGGGATAATAVAAAPLEVFPRRPAPQSQAAAPRGQAPPPPPQQQHA